MRAGDETVQLFEIDQPQCQLTYGSAPCAAILGTTGAHKCHNTFFTCQDTNNYSPITLVLRFARTQEEVVQYGPLIPSLVSVATTPAKVNLAAMARSSSSFGERESISVVLQDHNYSDVLTDKYRLERISGAASSPSDPYDPYTTGTFWPKFIARNPYNASYKCRVREGVLGDAIEDMRVREYIVDRIEGPTDGAVRLVAKDLFSKVEARKAMAPRASRGELKFAITDVAVSATLNPAGIGNAEYPASGYVAIGDEVIPYTRVADVLTLTSRGAFNTIPDNHDPEDLVQLVLTFTAERPHDITITLLTGYADLVDGVDFVSSVWDLRASEITDLYTARIVVPTPVSDLIGELEQQAGFTLWPDMATGQINFSALRAAAPSPEVDDSTWIVEGSMKLQRLVESRASEVHVYYGQIDPTKAVDERRNYLSRLIEEDADAAAQYGTALREVFSRWIPQFGRDGATRTAQRLLAMFKDPPLEAEFTMFATKADALSLGSYFTLLAEEVQDVLGRRVATTMAPTMIELGETEIRVAAQQVKFPAEPPPGEAEIKVFIENDAFNLDLRVIYDSLYAAPQGGDIIRFIIEDGVIVGSTSTSTYAMRTGATWPGGVTLIIENRGRIQGRAGDGAPEPSWPAVNGINGANGGDALFLEVATQIDNTDGEIFGGAGGGASGARFSASGIETSSSGAGGGGAGTDRGAAGYQSFAGTLPTDGTADVGGTHGTVGFGAGDGGDGGDPGEDGDNGHAASSGQPGGIGGTKGDYIVGNALATWTAVGDVRGGVS